MKMPYGVVSQRQRSKANKIIAYIYRRPISSADNLTNRRQMAGNCPEQTPAFRDCTSFTSSVLSEIENSLGGKTQFQLRAEAC
jgi:hypothetical protein